MAYGMSAEESRRIDTLDVCWHNEQKYALMLRTALEAIVTHPERTKELAEKALNYPRPPSVWDGINRFNEEGEFWTGHPYPEYLELPSKDPPDAPKYRPFPGR